MPETKSSEAKKREREKKSREDEEKSLTAYDMILRHEEKSRGEKVRLPHNFSYMYLSWICIFHLYQIFNGLFTQQ